MSNEERVDPTNLTLSQESELNAKAAATEGFEHKMAFEIYYKLGETRNHGKVAKQVGRSAKTIEKWAGQYRWTPRVKERERQAAEFLLMQKTAQEEAEVKKKHLTLIDATIGKWAKKLTDDKIRLRSVEDLERLVKLRWELTNMAEKRVNPTGMGGGGGMIDLRLRNMERGELQQFLYSTLKSIERVMNKKPGLPEPNESKPVNTKERLNLDISVSVAENSSEPIDVDPLSQDPDLPDVDDLTDDLAVNLDD